MKNILVPTDFSDCALNAVKFAAGLAKKSGATIHLVHIYQRVLTSSIEFEISFDASVMEREQAVFNKQMIKLTQLDCLKGIKVLCSLEAVYRLWDVLVMEKYFDADLIVMGSKGIDGVAEIFVGSNAQKFVQFAECPIIVIKEEVPVADIKNIVFASDFKKEVIPKYNTIKKFAQLVGAKLHYLKVMTPSDYFMEEEELEDRVNFSKATGVDISDIELQMEITVEKGILEFCKANHADMIALETHGKTGLAHLLQDNIAESLSNHSILPVFSVKIEKRKSSPYHQAHRLLLPKKLTVSHPTLFWLLGQFGQ